MTIEPYSITEWRWITEDPTFKKLRAANPLAAYLYRILWDYCAAHRTEVVSVWSSSGQLTAQLQTWSMFPMKRVRAALPFIWASGLAAFEGGVLYLRGPKKKHCTPRYSRWFDEAPAEIFDRSCQKSPERPEAKLTEPVKRLTENGFKPEPEPEPEREPLRPPLPPKAVDEFPTSEECPEEEACVCDTEEGTEDGEEEEIRQFLCDLARTYEDPSLQGCDFKFRQLVLRRRFNFGSARVEAQVLRCGRERLLAAAYYALTRARSSPEGTLYEYAYKRGNVPDSETIHRKVKEMLYG